MMMMGFRGVYAFSTRVKLIDTSNFPIIALSVVNTVHIVVIEKKICFALDARCCISQYELRYLKTAKLGLFSH